MVFQLPSTLNSLQLKTIAFLNGLNGDDSLATIDFFNWDGNNPAGYGPASNPNGIAHKWQPNAAGTQGAAGTQAVAGVGGGTVHVYFDPGSNWTTAEKSAFTSGLTLWSDYANITFTVVTNAAAADFTFYRYATTSPPNGGLQDGAYTSTGYANGATATGPTLGDISTDGYMSIDTNLYGFQNLDSFATEGGYGLTTVVHEEGHLLGLGHSGPYNGNVDPATQQLDAYDSRLYSIMSYIQPNDSSAAYYASYPVAGANWGSTADGGLRAPYTPQIFDILAVQQLYGLSTSTTFAGGQVFGFNSNITDGSKPFFDFTVDTTPVITLWDSGTNNTLDLSGYSSASTVDLNPGDFSSVAGLVDNIGIAYSTKIDTAIGGSGNDIFKVNTDTDTINGGGGTNTAIFPDVRAHYTIGHSGASVTVKDNLTNVTDLLTNIQVADFSDQNVPVCYLRGTHILTTKGEVAVEDLAIGDRLITHAGAARTLRWIGRRNYDRRFAAANPLIMPILIGAGALAENVPSRDLYVSPGHAMFLEGALIPAGVLVNGSTIRQVSDLARIAYYHLELDCHDVIAAEGAWSESYLDHDNRQIFHNAAEYSEMYQSETAAEISEYAPRREHGLLVDMVRAAIAKRAAASGHDPMRAQRLILAESGVNRTTIPRDVAEVHIISTADRAGGDHRMLGALVTEIRLDGQPIPLTDRSLVRGFHRVERHGETLVRWTNGDAAIVLPKADIDRLVEINVATLMAVPQAA